MDAGRASYQTAHTSGRTHGISYMLTKFIPILKEIGVSDKAIRDILINNPRRILSFNV
jgi:phosphotriesterase-related protein